MEKFGLFKNKKEIGRFSTVANRGEEGFLDEFYAILTSLLPISGDETIRNKVWSHVNEDFDFDSGEDHYAVRHYERI